MRDSVCDFSVHLELQMRFRHIQESIGGRPGGREDDILTGERTTSVLPQEDYERPVLVLNGRTGKELVLLEGDT